jgi:hypothetical protein
MILWMVVGEMAMIFKITVVKFDKKKNIPT